MTVFYTKTALRQIDTVVGYVADRSPQGADSLVLRLLQTVELLDKYPLSGQATSRPGIRRAVLSPYPYVIFYRVTGNDVIVLRLRHAARRAVR